MSKAGKKRRADLPALPPARRRAQAPGRRRPSGAGRRYLIQHSAGSGKSNSIAWLAHQLIGLDAKTRHRSSTRSSSSPTGACSTSRSATRSSSLRRCRATVGHAERLRRPPASSSKAARRSSSPRSRSSRSSSTRSAASTAGASSPSSSTRRTPARGADTAAKMNMALAEDGGADEEETVEDTINRIMETRKMLPNASYFAFTATPKNKTLEIFGEPHPRRAARSSTARSTATR